MNRKLNNFVLGCALATALLAAAATGAQADPALSTLAVYPPDIHLATQRDMQRFLVVATRSDGVTVDVTGKADVRLANPQIARLDGHALYPQADGKSTLEATYQGLTAQATVDVQQAHVDRPISFQLDVMPVFMRAGCNSGSCHGAARGKDGFRLSLFGYDPQGDYYRLTREIGFRRINLAVPSASLVLEKSLGKVQHTGGKRFAADSEYYATLLRWLEAGAPNDSSEPAHVEAVDLYPPSVVLEGAGATQQFVARARYSDGSDRDVTSLAIFLTNNDNSAPVSADGVVTAASRGEAFIMARFATHTVGQQAIILPTGLVYSKPKVEGNYIDQLVAQKLDKLRILPSTLCTDEEFLRRASVDIAGLLPTQEEYEQFVADTAPDKRARLVDRLLQRKEFSEIWAMKWAELLMVKSSPQVSYKSMFLYSNWLTDKIANNVPLNQMVRDLLSATGGTFSSPATNYYETERDTLKTSENVAEVFMGIRTQCAQCHNHPFDRWTMDDYYGFAAFFAQIGRKTGEDYRETVVFNSGGGEVTHPVGGRVMAPKFLGGAVADVKGKDRRAVLAEWLTSPENPFFAPSVANRVWAHFFGVGIVEPVDDVRVSNPPSNRALFETLGQKLIEYHYDFRQLVRDICNSQAYQRSTQTNESNEGDQRNFAHARVRRIRAEMLLDCICEITETPDKFRGLPLGARAVQIADGGSSNYFLTTFGRAARDTCDTSQVRTDPTLSQALHLLNGDTVQRKISEGGWIQRSLAAKQSPAQIIESIYVRCLTRHPTPEELQKLTAVVEQSGNPQTGLEDVFWAVLNSREFLFNH